LLVAIDIFCEPFYLANYNIIKNQLNKLPFKFLNYCVVNTRKLFLADILTAGQMLIML